MARSTFLSITCQPFNETKFTLNKRQLLRNVKSSLAVRGVCLPASNLVRNMLCFLKARRRTRSLGMEMSVSVRMLICMAINQNQNIVSQ